MWNNNKVILVKMPWRGPCSEDLIAPLSLGALSEVLIAEEISHSVFDLAADPNRHRDVFDAMKGSKLEFAGVSFGSAGYLKSYSFIRKLKKLRPDVKIIAGGWHPSSIGGELFNECPEVDYIVMGPGEPALRDIVTQGRSDLPGVLCKDEVSASNKEKIILRHQFRNYKWQFPRYQNMDLSPYKIRGEMGILTSRGCPSLCTFCSSTRVSGHGYIARDVDDILEEMKFHLAGGKVNSFQILDDNMTLLPDRAMDFFERVLKLRENYPALVISMPNGIRADRCDLHLLEAAKHCGVNTLLFGVESANDDMLKAMKKGETVEQIRTAIDNAFTAGLKIRLAFLIGMPGETSAHVHRSMDFVKNFGKPFSDIYVNHPIPFPGTELYTKLTSDGNLRISPDKYLNCSPGRFFGTEPIYSTPEMSLSQRKALFAQFQQLRREVCPNLPPVEPSQISKLIRAARPDKFAMRASRKIIRTASKLLGAGA